MKNRIQRLANERYLFKSTAGMALISIGLLFLAPLRDHGDVSRFLLSIMFILAILLWGFVVGEYVLKTMRLSLHNKKDFSVASMISINTILGVFLPIIFTNILLHKIIVDFWSKMADYDNILCEIRYEFIEYYQSMQIYSYLNSLSFWILLASIVLFIWGNFVENMPKKK